MSSAGLTRAVSSSRVRLRWRVWVGPAMVEIGWLAVTGAGPVAGWGFLFLSSRDERVGRMGPGRGQEGPVNLHPAPGGFWGRGTRGG